MEKLPVRHFSVDPTSPIGLLMELQTLRQHCIRSQSRADRSIETLIARTIGYNSTLPEVDRKKMFKVARTIRLNVENSMRDGNPANDPRLPPELCQLIGTSFVSRAQFDRQ